MGLTTMTNTVMNHKPSANSFHKSFYFATGFLLACAQLPNIAYAGQGYSIVGFGGGPKSLESYQGIINAPMGSLSQSGPIFRIWNKAYRFTYNTDLPLRKDVSISALGLSLEGEAGWQLVTKQARIALFGGIVWRDHFLNPGDPGSDLTKSRIGFSVTVDGEYKLGNDYGLMANASYLQGFNQYWSQFRPYLKTEFFNQGKRWKLGLDIAGFGGKNYNISRFGIFTSDFEVSLWSDKKAFIGGQAGVQYSINDKHISPYAGLNVGFLFSY